MSTIWPFDGTENNHGVYRGEGWMKKFCESLKKHAMKIINFKKNNMILLTNKELEWYANQGNCHICKKSFEGKYAVDKK